MLFRSVDRKKVVSEPLKELGTHVVAVVFHKEVPASVTVELVAESVAVENKVVEEVAETVVSEA